MFHRTLRDAIDTSRSEKSTELGVKSRTVPHPRNDLILWTVFALRLDITYAAHAGQESDGVNSLPQDGYQLEKKVQVEVLLHFH